MALLELDSFALRDERFTFLGDLTGRGKFDARARVENLWFDCIEKTNDIRTADEVDFATGWFDAERGRFADLMVKSRLADKDPIINGESLVGYYRIRGVGKRMKWLVDLRARLKESASKGGKVTAAKLLRRPDGTFQADAKQMLGSVQPTSNHNPTGTQSKPTFPVSDPVSVSDPDSSTDADTLFPEVKKLGASGKGKKRAPAKTSAVWEAFSDEYSHRYRDRNGKPIHPSDNATIRAQMANFIRKVGASDAPEIARFYVNHNHQFYVNKSHDFGLCLADATKLRTEWLSGRTVTSTQARQVDRTQTNLDVVNRVIEQFHGKGAGHG
jgi:hypothetical protein